MNALLTDLYQLTMAAGYFAAGKLDEVATFELFVRRLPPHRNFLIAAGLQQAVDYLLNLRFTGEEISYLRTLPAFRQAPPGFFDYLRQFRFTGSVHAIAEGTPVFANEPLMTIEAPLVEAQMPETFLLATLGFQTLIASKAARVAQVAQQHTVVEMGTRRAHSPEAGVLAARAAYLGGCSGSSNVEAGMRYGVPLYGTAAHGWVMSFPTEREAFERLQKLLGPNTVYLIDTYDTAGGARLAGSLGQPMRGVRLDSGDLLELSQQVRTILDEAGLKDAQIMATGDLNEYKILELLKHQAPIDSFGVGTELATSSDAPAMSAVYKLAEIDVHGVRRYTAKFSAGKNTMPGSKQIYRFADHDLVATAHEPAPSGAPSGLLQPVILHGELVQPLPPLEASRRACRGAIRRLPSALRSLFDAEQPYRVAYSTEMQQLQERVKSSAPHA